MSNLTFFLYQNHSFSFSSLFTFFSLLFSLFFSIFYKLRKSFSLSRFSSQPKPPLQISFPLPLIQYEIFPPLLLLISLLLELGSGLKKIDSTILSSSEIEQWGRRSCCWVYTFLFILSFFLSNNFSLVFLSLFTNSLPSWLQVFLFKIFGFQEGQKKD